MKYFITILLFSFSIASAVGQQGRHNIGLSFGPNWTLGGSTEEVYSGTTNGVDYEYRFSERWGAQIGINYLQLNLEAGQSSIILPSDVLTRPGKTELAIDYIEIPLLLSLDLNTKDDARFKPYVLVGYSLARVVRASKKEYFNSGIESGNANLKPEDKTRHFLNAGLELRYHFLEKFSVSLGGQYKVTGLDEELIADIHNWNVFFRLGRFF
jgi:opacity protein-like surface antigen